MATTNKSNRVSRGAMIAIWVFATPFLLAAAWNGWAAVDTFAEFQSMKSWVEVPATIESVELERHQGSGGRSVGKRRRIGGGRYLRTTATYSYEYQGKSHQEERVGLHTGSDNAGDFPTRVYAELKQRLDEKKPFRCFVNSANPEQAALYRDLRPEIMTIRGVMVVAFGGVGTFFVASAHYYWRKQRRNESSVERDSEPPVVTNDS